MPNPGMDLEQMMMDHRNIGSEYSVFRGVRSFGFFIVGAVRFKDIQRASGFISSLTGENTICS